MKNAIKERVDKLADCFNEEWISNFHALIELFDQVPRISDLISEFEEKKHLDCKELRVTFSGSSA